MNIVAMDIGGTNARFGLAQLDGRQVGPISHQTVFKAADFPNLETAWQAFGKAMGAQLPTDVAMGVACPVREDEMRLTNSPWIIRPSELRERLGLSRLEIINDFGAVGHAVAQLDAQYFTHLCGPDVSLPQQGVISIVGPGTGLGVALIVRSGVTTRVIETEGGHVEFAAGDEIDEAIVSTLRARHGRVSAERMISGPGLANIYEGLSRASGIAGRFQGEIDLWSAALDKTDDLAVVALDRLLSNLGRFAGDVALVHGAVAVVIAGGLGRKLAGVLPYSPFAGSFIAKGRFEGRLAAVPVKLLNYPEPGLFGAAAAFAHSFA